VFCPEGQDDWWRDGCRARFDERYGLNWLALKRFVARRAQGRCESCRWSPYRDPTKSWWEPYMGGRHFEFDHIKEIAAGGDPLGRSNVQLLCRECHRRKTAEFNRSRGRAQRSLKDVPPLEAFGEPAPTVKQD
jgi:hypothetical protein